MRDNRQPTTDDPQPTIPNPRLPQNAAPLQEGGDLKLQFLRGGQLRRERTGPALSGLERGPEPLALVLQLHEALPVRHQEGEVLGLHLRALLLGFSLHSGSGMRGGGTTQGGQTFAISTLRYDGGLGSDSHPWLCFIRRP